MTLSNLCQFEDYRSMLQIDINGESLKDNVLNDIVVTRHMNASLVELFAWTEKEFKEKTKGTAIQRIGYQSWLRNIAVGLGNAPTTKKVGSALKSRQNNSSMLVNEHVDWALKQH